MESLLLIPAVAMGFTNEVSWTLSDFVIAFFLLLGLATGLHFVWHSKMTKSRKWWLLLMVLLIFLLVWAELAVGVFNSPWAGN